MTAGLRRWLVAVLRIGVTLGSFVVVVRLVSAESTLHALARVDPMWLAAAVALFTPSQLVNAQRLRYIAVALGKKLSFARATAAHFIMMWFNQILPTSVGGDAVKAFVLRSDLGTSVAIRTTILDRASGLLIVFASTLVLMPVYIGRLGVTSFTVSLALGCAGSLGAVSVCSWYCATRRPRWANLPGLSHARDLMADFFRFRRPRELCLQIATSLFIHAAGIGCYALLGRALGLDLGLMDYILFAPLVFLFAAIPFSYASWGIREIGAVWLFGLAGASGEKALALSVLYGLLCLIGTLPGAYFALKESRAVPA